MTIAWAAVIIGAAAFVQGVAGFGLGLVALALLPYLMAPTVAVVVVVLCSAVTTLVMLVLMRRDVTLASTAVLLVGALAGTPLGVWVLASVPPAALNRLIGAVLVVAVVLELRDRCHVSLRGPRWGLGAGLLGGILGGILGGAVGAPGPPVILYAASQDWRPRTMKANLQLFFLVNQVAVILGYWWTGVLGRAVFQAAAVLTLPALGGLLAGMAVFARVDHARFRQVVFALLLVSGLVLLLGG